VGQKIKVSLPLNIELKDICYFEKSYYKLSRLKIILLRNTIITFNGICLQNYDIIKESVHGYRDKLIIYKLTSKLDLLDYATFLLNNSDTFILIHGPIYNYYHWLTESIPRLLLVRYKIKHLTLLLPESLKNNDFVKQTLAPFDFNDVVYIPKKCNIKIKKLVLPQIKPFCSSYDPLIVNDIRKLYTDYSKDKTPPILEYCARIFICSGKEISNFDEVSTFLRLKNFHYLNINLLSFYDLVVIMEHTQIIVFATRNNFVCISFMKPQTSVLELININALNIEGPNKRCINLASALGLKYYYQLCNSSCNLSLPSNFRIKVDLKKLEENINLIIMS
jgi:capsular polysaccharide biosynthesis protein